ncbi:ankyrin repeat domain-containing protein [Lentzea albida]|uniref:Ankyrin repeats (3 copies) n=1 Tax=Lentzea albida TaxID=65499 RepID=A0A1H9F2W8_9PSEU|nr:ankyrin repeat domain-containing protein [Lentzea albida]SEQ32255.1 Ankyrin repeats (3 copies) [Lentzea albida]
MGEHTLEELHWAAEFKSPEEVAALIAEVDDVDALDEGRTALWRAVHASRFGNVEVLLAAGADPARSMMYGWSPARLSLATEHPLPTDEVLTPEERAAIAERDRLVAALGGVPRDDGHSLACVAGIDAETAVHRLEAEPVEVTEQVWTWDADQAVVGVTTVPGGCVVMQPKGFAATHVLERLSVGTVGFGMFANPKGGNHGEIHRDGECEASDLATGAGADLEDTAADVLLAHLYQGEPVAYCLAFAGLRPTDARAFTAPDLWVRLPGHLTA